MSMTIIEKIFARKAGLDRVSPGETVVVDVDMTVLIDLQFATMWLQPLRIHDPDKLAIVMDHAVPAPTIKDAAGGPLARKFAAEFFNLVGMAEWLALDTKYARLEEVR